MCQRGQTCDASFINVTYRYYFIVTHVISLLPLWRHFRRISHPLRNGPRYRFFIYGRADLSRHRISFIVLSTSSKSLIKFKTHIRSSRFPGMNFKRGTCQECPIFACGHLLNSRGSLQVVFKPSWLLKVRVRGTCRNIVVLFTELFNVCHSFAIRS